MGLRYCVICKSQKYAITKEPLIIGLFGGKWPVQIRRLKGLCHTVSCKSQMCHMGMSHVTYEWVMSRMNESCHVWMSHVTYEWVVARMNESWHVWMSRVTYGWVVSHTNESRYADLRSAPRAIQMFICVLVDTYIYMDSYTCLCKYVYTYMYQPMYIYVCTIYGSIHIFTAVLCTCTCICVCMYT